MNRAQLKPDHEIVSAPQRVLEPMISIVAMALLVGFYAYHQVMHTGFFTGEFGPLEMLCLYGTAVLSIIPPLIRAATGRRNPSRPLEAVDDLLLGVAALVLLVTFPFNFAHFTDALPSQIRFMFSWLNNGIARIFLWLPLIFGPFAALVITVQFLVVSWRESIRITSSHQQFS
jgi:hypothetical protein